MKRFLAFLLSLTTVLGLAVSPDGASLSFREPQSFFYLPLLILTAYGINHIFHESGKRLKAFSFCLSLFLSICHLFGGLLAQKGTILWLFRDVQTLLLGILTLFSYTVLLFCLVFYAFRFLARANPAHGRLPEIPAWGFWLLLVIAWIPWFLNQYPAVMTADTSDQLEMALGLEPLTNHHPVFYTFLLKGFLWLGTLITKGGQNANQTGIALFCGVQLLVMAAAYAAVLRVIWRNTSSDALRIGSLLFFMFYPVHPLYSVTVWKDVPFAVCLLLLIVLLACELKEHSAGYCIGMALCGILLSLLRHNGIYLIILALPFLPGAFKGRWKPVLLSFLAVILVFAGLRVLLKWQKIPDGRASEAFSLPLQQIALTAKRQHAAMDEELLAELNSYFMVDEIWERYTYRISDPVKNVFNEELYSSDRVKFWKFWLVLGILYPQDYIDALMLHTYGYWYPETPHWVFITGIDDNGLFDIRMDPKQGAEWMNDPVKWLSDSGYDRIPLLSLLFSPGACFWVCLTAFWYCVYRRSPAYILFIPLFILWLTALASPVNCEYRYVYAMFAAIPLLLSALPVGLRSR